MNNFIVSMFTLTIYIYIFHIRDFPIRDFNLPKSDGSNIEKFKKYQILFNRERDILHFRIKV